MTRYLNVETTSDVRRRLTQILAEFREQGLAARPVVFGSHRKPEAVLLPAELVEDVLPVLLDPGFDLPGRQLPRLGPRAADADRYEVHRPKQMKAG